MNLAEYKRMYDVEDSHWWYVGLHQLILNVIKRESLKLERPLTIFDAGCGTGRLCQLLLADGHAVRGCDAAEEALSLCDQRGVKDVFQADLNTLELEDETFDVITSIDVLYHAGIRDDVAVMKRLKNGLKPGGMLILNLVAHEFLRSTHDIAVHTRERYTKNMLGRRLQEAGFRVDLISYRVSIIFPVIFLYRMMVKKTLRKHVDEKSVDSDVSPQHTIINYLLLKLIQIENSWLKRFNLPLGSSVFAIVRKPVKYGEP